MRASQRRFGYLPRTAMTLLVAVALLLAHDLTGAAFLSDSFAAREAPLDRDGARGLPRVDIAGDVVAFVTAPPLTLSIYERNGDFWPMTFRTAAPSGRIGYVAATPDAVFVGDPGDSTVGSNAGAVHIYERRSGGWEYTRSLFPWDANPSGVSLGIELDADGDTLVAGSVRDRAYVFERQGTGWHGLQTIQGADTSVGDRFSYDLAVSGSTIAVGADAEDNPGFNSGAAYVFERGASNWVETHKLSPPEPQIGFGAGVALDGDLLMIGSRDDVVFAYERTATGWGPPTAIQADDEDPTQRSNFGHRSVAVSGDFLLVGANQADFPARGAAYLFQRLGPSLWRQVARLLPPNPTTDQNFFGRSAAVSGMTAVVPYAQDSQSWGSVFDFFPNAAPVADAGGNIEAKCTSLWYGLVEVDASGSFDPDGDPLTYEWRGPFIESGGRIVSSVPQAILSMPIGMSTLNLTVSDGFVEAADSLSVSITCAPLNRLEFLKQEIIKLQDAGHLNNGEAGSLIAKIDGAIDQIDKGRMGPAINKLEALINEFEALKQSGRLTGSQVDPLIAVTSEIIVDLITP